MINQPPEYQPEDVRLHIRTEVEKFKALDYGWDYKSALPLREDVYRFLCHRATSEALGLDLRKLDMPVVKMSTNGVINLSFFRAGRQLTLTFPCEGVVLYHQLHDDKVTTVSGVIRVHREVDTAEAWEEVNAKLDWCFPKRFHGMKRRESVAAYDA